MVLRRHYVRPCQADTNAGGKAWQFPGAQSSECGASVCNERATGQWRSTCRHCLWGEHVDYTYVRHSDVPVRWDSLTMLFLLYVSHSDVLARWESLTMLFLLYVSHSDVPARWDSLTMFICGRYIVTVCLFLCLFVFVILCVCTVTYFSTEDKVSGINFCMVVYQRSGQRITHFGELCSPRSPKSDKSASHWEVKFTLGRPTANVMLEIRRLWNMARRVGVGRHVWI